MLYGVIIAGGAGKRLWPRSRSAKPKYLLRFKKNKSLLQETVERARQIIPLENILVITNKEHVRLIRKELPKLPGKNIIGEPVSRNTAPCICLAAALIKKRDPSGVIFVMPADHVIEDKLAMKDVFGFASLIAGIKECLLTVGVRPSYPSTGYGYIKTGKLYKRLLADRKIKVHKVDRFIEKPGFRVAKGFLKSSRYLWNSGMFIGKAQAFLDEFKRYRPSIYKIVQKIEKGLGTARQQGFIDRYYRKFPNISIDYAIMEKTRIAHVITADIEWQDIGSWKSLADYIKADAKGNIIEGDSLTVDTKGSIVIGEKGRLIATLGLDNIIVIQDGDATLVCAKDRAEEVKAIVELARKKGLKRYL